MKTLATNDPSRAVELLTQAPQLSYAVFQALLIMGLVSPEAINSVLDTGAGVPPPPVAGYAPVATSTPPVAVGGYAPPPAPAPAPAQDPEALMRAVLELPQETIDQLPEVERQQIMALRAQYAAQLRR
jgi:cleavage stimulation factor subunit 2